MKHVKLDRIDLKILRELQQDGRMTNVDLAERVGISAPPCLRRVRALEEEGFIRSYHADVDPGKLGFGVTVFTFVSLANHAESDLIAFAELTKNWGQVRECYTALGEADFILRVVAEDLETYQRFLTHDLAGAANVAHVRSAILAECKKFEPGVPIEDKGAPAPAKKE